jgi:hypothetical protein
VERTEALAAQRSVFCPTARSFFGTARPPPTILTRCFTGLLVCTFAPPSFAVLEEDCDSVIASHMRQQWDAGAASHVKA